MTAMTDRLNRPKPADLADDVKAGLLRRRDTLDGGEPTVEASKAFDQLRRKLRERSKPSTR
jgi:hypothetical protein